MVGLMGVGKSTIGAALAARLGWSFRDSDTDILAATGLTAVVLGDAGQVSDQLAALAPVGVAASTPA